MNIKTTASHLSPLDRIVAGAQAKGQVRSEQSNPDRDPGGQQHQSRQEGKEFLSEEEMERVLRTLSEFPGVKDSHLSVELIHVEDRRFVLIKDLSGAIVRRIPERDLWPLLAYDKGKTTGHLLNKSG